MDAAQRERVRRWCWCAVTAIGELRLALVPVFERCCARMNARRFGCTSCDSQSGWTVPRRALRIASRTAASSRSGQSSRRRAHRESFRAASPCPPSFWPCTSDLQDFIAESVFGWGQLRGTPTLLTPSGTQRLRRWRRAAGDHIDEPSRPGHLLSNAPSSYSPVMGASVRRRVRWWWLAIALVALVAVVLLAGDRSGSCAEYVNSPGVCTSVNEDPRTWVLVGIGALIVIGALYGAFRRR